MQELETWIQAQLEQSQTPGLAITVARHGQVIYERSFGYRDREAQLPFTLDTVNGLGSIGKTFTAVAILQLQEAGLLSVHDPVRHYLPAFRVPDPASTDSITLHHLLTHTSGLPDLPFLTWAFAPSIMADPTSEGSHWRATAQGAPPLTTIADLLHLFAEHPYEMLGAPGRFMSYSNEGYGLLGAVIEAVSGMTYDEYITERIAKPAGMASFTADLAGAQAGPDVVTRYTSRLIDGTWQVVRSPLWWEDPVLRGAGGAHHTSVRDLLRLAELFRSGGVIEGARILQSDSVAMLLHPHAPIPPLMAYGYGILVEPDVLGTTLLSHNGGIKGVSASFGYMPEHDLTFAAIANFQGAPIDSIVREVLRTLLDLPKSEDGSRFPDYDCPPALLEAYMGTYPGTGAPIVAVVEEGRLVFKLGGQTDPLRPIGPHAFALKLGQVEHPIAFLVDEEGCPFAMQMGTRVRRKA